LKRSMRLTTMKRASSFWQFSGKLLDRPVSGHKVLTARVPEDGPTLRPHRR
jgi:hypothetical protein